MLGYDPLGYEELAGPGNSFIERLQAALSLVVGFPISTAHLFGAKLTLTGTVVKVFTISKLISATLIFSGILTKTFAISKKVIGTLTFLGSLSPKEIKTFVAALSFVSHFEQKIVHSLSALLTFSTRLLDYVLYGFRSQLSLTGTLSKHFEFVKQLIAQLEFAGKLQRAFYVAQHAVLSFAGNLRSADLHQLSGSLSFFDVSPRNVSHSLLAKLESKGLLNRNILYMIGAIFSFGSALSRAIFDQLKAKLEFAGNLRSDITYILLASVSFVGSIASRTTARFQTATFSFSGSVQNKFAKAFEAILFFAGTTRRNMTHRLVANLTLAGFIRSSGKFIQNLTASLEWAGVLPLSTSSTLTAVLTFSGNTPRQIYYRIRSSISFAGSSIRSNLHYLRAELSSVGLLIPHVKFVRLIIAALNFNGRERRNIGHAFSAVLKIIGFIDFEKVLGFKPIPDILILRHEEPPVLTLRRTETGNVYGLIDRLKGFPEMELQSIVRQHRVFRKSR